MKTCKYFLLLVVSLVLISCNQSAPQVDVETVIVGGGIAGLTSAYYLDKAGHDFIVFEKEDQVGGKAVSGVKDGFYYARGTEYIGPPEAQLKEMIDKLKIDLREIPSPMDIHYANHKRYYGDAGLILHLVEESSIEEFNRFVKEVLRVYSEYEELPYYNPNGRLAGLDEMTASQWLKDNDFSQVYYDVYNVTSKGLFGATLEEVSALNMIPEIAFDFDNITIQEEDLKLLEANNRPFKSLSGSNAYSFDKGIAELPLAIYDQLKDNIHLSSPVIKVEAYGDLYKVTYKKDGKVQHLVSNNVIMAVPSPLVSVLTKNILDPEQSQILDQIPYANYITAALYTDEYLVNEAFDMAVPDKMFFTDIYDGTWIQRAYDDMVKDKRSSVMSLYIAPESYKSKELDGMTDREVLDRIYKDLNKINGYEKIQDHVTGYDIYHIKYAYPIMVPGAYKRLSNLHDSLHGRFQLAGDYMIYPTLEGAVESGYIAAKKILEFK